MTQLERNKQQKMSDAFLYLFADIDPDTPEDIDDILRSAGFDPASYSAKIEALAKNALADQAKRQIEQARQQLENKNLSPRSERPTIISLIQQVLSQLDEKNRLAFSHHRNLESASDADLQSLLDELSYLVNSNNSPEQE